MNVMLGADSHDQSQTSDQPQVAGTGVVVWLADWLTGNASQTLEWRLQSLRQGSLFRGRVKKLSQQCIQSRVSPLLQHLRLLIWLGVYSRALRNFSDIWPGSMWQCASTGWMQECALRIGHRCEGAAVDHLQDGVGEARPDGHILQQPLYVIQHDHGHGWLHTWVNCKSQAPFSTKHRPLFNHTQSNSACKGWQQAAQQIMKDCTEKCTKWAWLDQSGTIHHWHAEMGSTQHIVIQCLKWGTRKCGIQTQAAVLPWAVGMFWGGCREGRSTGVGCVKTSERLSVWSVENHTIS